MNEFITFLVKNWHLTLPFVGILFLIIITEFKEGQGGSSIVNPDELTKLINRDNALILDLRDEESYQNGHIVDSKVIMIDDFEKSLKKFTKHKSKPCVLVDADGRNFQQFLKQCHEFGFEQVFGLKGGISAWKEAGLPLVSR